MLNIIYIYENSMNEGKNNGRRVIRMDRMKSYSEPIVTVW